MTGPEDRAERRERVRGLERAGDQDDRCPVRTPFQVPRVPAATFGEAQVRWPGRGTAGRQVVAEARGRDHHDERHDGCPPAFATRFIAGRTHRNRLNPAGRTAVVVMLRDTTACELDFVTERI